MSELKENVDDDARLLGQVLAFLILLACSFAENGMGQFPGLFGCVPKLTFVVVFMVCLYHPTAIPLASVVLVGLVHDLIQGNPLGYSSGLMLVVHGWVAHRRLALAQLEKASVWIEFTALMAVVALLVIFALLLYSGRMPALQPLIFQYGLTVLAFPVVNWVHQLALDFASMLEQMR